MSEHARLKAEAMLRKSAEARVRAAAPELLTALKECYVELRFHNRNGGPLGEGALKARIAIEAATGKRAPQTLEE